MFKIIYRHVSSQSFRKSFVSNISDSPVEAWFPRHMYKGIKQMQAKMAVVDCFIEVHDARIPLSGRNPKFYSMLTAVRPHIFILNKCDLIDMSLRNKIIDQLQKENIKNVLFTDCKKSSKAGINKIIPMAIDLVKEADNYNRANALSINVMVIGIPNVGKSSLINRLRNIHLHKKKATAVGANPGMTKSVLEKIKIYQNPLVYLFDTPGVMTPSISDIETGLKLAVCKTLKDHLVGEELLADYLLYWLNKNQCFSYVNCLQLDEPTDDVRLLLFNIAKNQSFTQRIKSADGLYKTVPDFQRSASYFLTAFREGVFGQLCLDIDYINKIP